MARPVDPTLRLRLVEAATAEFVESGYQGASMTGIGSRAGVTKGGVYFHFRSKEELFFAALDHWHGELRGRVAAGDWVSAAGAESLEGFLRAYLDAHFTSPGGSRLLRVLTTELSGAFTAQLRQDTRQEQRWLRGQIRELLARGSQAGALFVEDPAQAAFVLAGAVGGILDQWAAAPEDVGPFCSPAQLAATLVRPYRGSGMTRDDEEDRFSPSV